jgi:hypothetical protein
MGQREVTSVGKAAAAKEAVSLSEELEPLLGYPDKRTPRPGRRGHSQFVWLYWRWWRA